MEWIGDPAAWAGLVTLVVLEIVLGIDNLVFIAILTDKLPGNKKDKARVVGLSLALFMRLGMLAGISWLADLTEPLFSVAGMNFSGRDLILFIGGLFLLFKATTELHERLEGSMHVRSEGKAQAGFAIVVAQIVALDAVFSLDSVITAVGMVDELSIMMLAVVLAMILMLFASKPLTEFVNAHPSVVVLCLSFLLMIGLSLVAEGFSFHIPKGYLYAAIGFSLLIEFFNQLAQRNRARNMARMPLRDRTATAVLRLLGKRDIDGAPEADDVPAPAQAVFAEEERQMVSEVLALADRPIRSIMTPRRDIDWIAMHDSAPAILATLRRTPHSVIPVCRSSLDDLVGVARTKDIFQDVLGNGKIDAQTYLRDPVVLHNATRILKAIEVLKHADSPIALVADEFGTIQGLITPVDILEAIAGEFPDEGEHNPIEESGKCCWKIDGSTALRHVQETLGLNALGKGVEDHATLSEILVAHFGKLPEAGDTMELNGYLLEATEIADRRIATVRLSGSAPSVPGRSEPRLE